MLWHLSASNTVNNNEEPIADHALNSAQELVSSAARASPGLPAGILVNSGVFTLGIQILLKGNSTIAPKFMRTCFTRSRAACSSTDVSEIICNLCEAQHERGACDWVSTKPAEGYSAAW